MFADIIRDRVSALDAGVALGLDPDRDGRCACPVHGGRNRNCKLFDGDRGFYCYKCHTGGDVIRLVETVNQCTFIQAVSWLNSAFHLGIDIDTPLDKNAKIEAENARKRRERERAEQRRREWHGTEGWLIADGNLDWAERMVERYAPDRPGRKWDWRFETALKLMPELRDDEARARITAWEKQK